MVAARIDVHSFIDILFRRLSVYIKRVTNVSFDKMEDLLFPLIADYPRHRVFPLNSTSLLANVWLLGVDILRHESL